MTPVLRSLSLVPLVLLAADPVARGDGEVEVRRNRVVQVVERARPATVAIHTTQIIYRRDFFGEVWPDLPPIESEGLGSGTIFHPAGFVITNAHVIARASKILVDVTLPVRGPVQREGRLFAVDVPNDLAIVRLVPPTEEPEPPVYPMLPLGRSNDLMIGEDVIAVGSPFGLGFTVTTGVIGGLNRTIPVQGARARSFEDFVQIDAAINPGNSGGPLFDVTGRWIGVTTAILNRSRTGAEGIGFAIPADRVRALIGRAFQRRRISGDWLGIEEKDDPTTGAPRAAQVYDKGPAAGSGVKAGDVIVSVNGKATPTLFEYRMEVSSLPAGSMVTLGISRPGASAMSVRLPLAPVPTEQLSEKHLGMRFAEVDEEITRETQLPFDAGVFVRETREGGPAERIKLRQGDLIVGLGTERVRNADDVLLFLQHVRPGDLVTVRVRRPTVVPGENRVLWTDKQGTLVAE